MKKFILSFILILCLFITGCSNSTRAVSTIDNFSSFAEDNSFSVKTDLEKYGKVDYITGSASAVYGEDIEIEMIVYSNEDYAIQVQDQQIESFNLLKSTSAYVDKEKGKNYYDYTLVSNNRYMVSSRIDNTLIFAKVNLDDRDIVENFIDSLGY